MNIHRIVIATIAAYIGAACGSATSGTSSHAGGAAGIGGVSATGGSGGAHVGTGGRATNTGGTSGLPGAGGAGFPLGSACVPADESSPSWSGFSVTEVNLGADDTCSSGLCLANHFQGRVTCPYGQTQTEIDSLPPDDPARCRLPGTTNAVTAPVDPTLSGRTAKDAVYCSCHCAGPDTTATYCACPGGFDCVDLVPNLGTPNDISGSYCVKSGTAYDRAHDYGPVCSTSDASTTAACGANNP